MPKRGGYKPARLADVAASLGLSPAAVSLALRGKAGVSEATRERVVEAARDLGYVPSASLNRDHQRQFTIGLVIKAVHGDSPEANRFYAPVMAGIEESCRAHGLNLMLATMPVDKHYHPLEIPRIMTDRTCDGLVVLGAHLSRTTAEILEQAPPAVLVDAYSEDDGFDSVATDNVGGARLMVEHLIDHGHREIAVLGGGVGAYPSIVQRRRGYDLAIGQAGLTPRHVDGDYWPPDAAACAGVEYLRSHREVSAVFCVNDDVAIALIQALRETDIKVPNQVSIAGFDDIDTAGFISPALTTMAVDKVGMGRVAIALLAERLDLGKDSVTQTLVRPQLVERTSVRSLERSGRKTPTPTPTPAQAQT